MCCDLGALGRYKADENIQRDMKGPKGFELRLYVPIGEFIYADASTSVSKEVQQGSKEQKNVKPEELQQLKGAMFHNHPGFTDDFFADTGGQALRNKEAGQWAPDGQGPWISPAKGSDADTGEAIVKDLLAAAGVDVSPTAPATPAGSSACSIGMTPRTPELGSLEPQSKKKTCGLGFHAHELALQVHEGDREPKLPGDCSDQRVGGGYHQGDGPGQRVQTRG